MNGTDLIEVKRWEQRFKMWVEAARKLARAQDYIADMKMRVGKRMDISSATGSIEEQLSTLLDLDAEWHLKEGFPAESVVELCRDLRFGLL